MTKLTRSTIQWNSGIMLGWNSSGTMKGIMHPRNKNNSSTHEHDPAELYHSFRGTTDRNNSSFFPETPNGNNRRKSKPHPRTTSTRREYFEPQKDFSVEFLEYVRSLSKRDFEHAVPDNTNTYQQMLVDRNNNPVYPLRPGAALRRPVVDPYSTNNNQFFSPTIVETHNLTRPATVPRYTARQPNANNNRGVLRPSEGVSSFPVQNLENSQDDYNSRVRALTRTKVTPSEIDNSYGDSQQESFSATGSPSDRPVSAASSQGGPKRVTFAADVVNYERENKPSKKVNQ